MNSLDKNLLTLLNSSRGVLFDFNGTLSDDETELEQAYGAAIKARGYKSMAAEEYAQLLGLSEPDIAIALATARGGNETDASGLLADVAEQYRAIVAASPRVSAESVRMVDLLEFHGIKVGIVTGTLRSLIEPVLIDRGLARLLRTLITIEDVSQGKPDPEGFLAGANLLGLDDQAESIVVFEDSRAGVAAAKAAGMHTVGVNPDIGAELTFPHMDYIASLIIRRLSLGLRTDKND